MPPNLSLALSASLVSLVFLSLFLLLLAGVWWLLIGRTRPHQPKLKPTNAVLSPSAGKILSVAVRPGDKVAFGQELCTFESEGRSLAIRSARPGEIGSVNVAAGDQITRGQVILVYHVPPKDSSDESNPSLD